MFNIFFSATCFRVGKSYKESKECLMKASENYLQNGSYPLITTYIKTMTLKLLLVIWSVQCTAIYRQLWPHIGYVLLYLGEAVNFQRIYLPIFYFVPNAIPYMMPSIFFRKANQLNYLKPSLYNLFCMIYVYKQNILVDKYEFTECNL